MARRGEGSVLVDTDFCLQNRAFGDGLLVPRDTMQTFQDRISFFLRAVGGQEIPLRSERTENWRLGNAMRSV